MNYEESFNFEGLRVVRSSYACPESYKVYEQDNLVGFLRLRHGVFRVDYYPLQLHKVGVEDSRETLYEEFVNSDGIFDDAERKIKVPFALELILSKLADEKKEINESQTTQRS
jgi:hypothetical protein